MQTLFIGQSLFFLHEIESTNTYANDLLKNVNPPEGTIVHTDNQTKGRGQRGSSWNSEIAQNITVSVVLKPTFLSLNQHFYLSKITALALYDVLAELLPNSQYDIKIKWPNDILVNQKKIAGVLIENTIQQQGLQHSVIGIGLNVNQANFDELNSTATSLKTLRLRYFDKLSNLSTQSPLNNDFDRKIVLEKICQQLEKWYLKLKANNTELIDLAYKTQLFKLNEPSEFINNKTQTLFKGTITDVTKDGRLEITVGNEELNYFELKEVRIIF